MKAVIGVDLAGSYEVALRLFESLGLGSWELDLINVVEPVLPDGAFPELQASNPLIRILDDLTLAGKKLLEDTSNDLRAKGRKVSSDVLMGSPVGELLMRSEKSGAEVVAVGSQRKSLVESFFTGSVARTLATSCKSSVLIAKHAPNSTKGLTAVFAHDLSNYADWALERFVGWGCTGMDRIVLVTADTTDPSIAALIERQDPEMAGETIDVARQSIESRQLEIVDRLRAVCANVEKVVSEGTPNDVINQTVKSSGADLLVMGSQGHGFLERLVVGSTALHHVVREEHNVLLVRA